jgi:hypothetical protein
MRWARFLRRLRRALRVLLFVFCMPGAAVLDLASLNADVDFDETVYFWPILLLLSGICWLTIWFLFCMVSLLYTWTAPVAGVLSYACVRGRDIFTTFQHWTGQVNGSVDASMQSYNRTPTVTSHEQSRTQHYEISVERSSFVGAVRLIAFGLYLVTVGTLQALVSILTVTMQNRILMMGLTAALAVLMIS